MEPRIYLEIEQYPAGWFYHVIDRIGDDGEAIVIKMSCAFNSEQAANHFGKTALNEALAKIPESSAWESQQRENFLNKHNIMNVGGKLRSSIAKLMSEPARYNFRG